MKTPLSNSKVSSPIVAATLCLWLLLPAQGAEAALRSGLPHGAYTGAEQVMTIGADGKPSYPDHLSICHIRVLANDRLQADFPSSTGIPEGVELQLSATEPRATWTARLHGNTYQAIAIPFSSEAYVFRLEILREGKLIGGAQQFHAISRSGAAEKK
jgi:hypothetical protein